MSGRSLQGVVFDVDGVLFDTERLTHQTWLTVGNEMGWPQIGEHYLEFVGQNRTDIHQKMRDLFGPEFPKEEFMKACSAYSQARMEREGVPMKPGVVELLDALKSRNIPMALATSTGRERTLRRMELTGLGPTSPPSSPATRWSTASPTRRSISWPAGRWALTPPVRWLWRTPATASSPPPRPE